jgi:hypothetical protein
MLGKVCEIVGCHCSAVKDISLWEFLIQQHIVTLEKEDLHLKEVSLLFWKNVLPLSELCSSDKPKSS